MDERGWYRYTISRTGSRAGPILVLGRVPMDGGEETLVLSFSDNGIEHAKLAVAAARTVTWEERDEDDAYPAPFDFGAGVEDLLALSRPYFYDARHPLITEKVDAPSEDRWICRCGNEPTDEGFYPCTDDGEAISWENTMRKDWSGRLYICARCGRIIDGATLEVVSWRHDPRTRPDPCPRCGGDHDRIDSREPCPEEVMNEG